MGSETNNSNSNSNSSSSNSNSNENNSNGGDDCSNAEKTALIGAGNTGIDEQQLETTSSHYLAKFKLYETRANFYMVGSDKSKRFWRILKIDRLASSNLVVFEDPTVYSAHECSVILKRIDEGNKHAGGLKIVTTCYGIVGFVKFLGPYYMILITERRKVGKICGHAIYAVSKSKMIQIPHSPARFDSINSKNEKRSFVYSACKCKMYLILVRDAYSIRIVLLSFCCCHSPVSFFDILSSLLVCILVYFAYKLHFIWRCKLYFHLVSL